MTKILYGKPVAEKIDEQTTEEISKHELSLKLAIVVSQGNEAALSYSKQIQNKAAKLNIKTDLIELSSSTTQKKANDIVDGLSKDKKINGIIIQSPLSNVDINFVRLYLDPMKDVDGATETSMGMLFEGKPRFIPATAEAVMEILKHYDIKISGKKVVVIGRSTIVGKPLTHLLLGENATVTVCHSKTPDISVFTQKADIVICAAGKAGLLTADMINQNSVVIDVGTNFENGKMVGDVDFDSVSKAVSAISPVPGGVGPVTVSVLLSQVVKYAKKL